MIASPALSAKNRKRGPTVSERLRAEDAAWLSDYDATADVVLDRRGSDSQGTGGGAVKVTSTGGKSRKSGMVLARAQLAAAANGVIAARDRQNALLSKGTYRKAEGVAREAPVGTLAVKDMPKRKDAKSAEEQAQFKEKFGAWMRASLSPKVKQTRTAAGYEKMVLRVNEWMVEQGYDAFAHVVEVSEKRYRLELLSADGVPRVPSLEAVIEFVIGMSTGEVEKGGSREARGKDWYASPLWGKSQAELCMPEEKKGAYGWGAFKDLPYRLGRIEQHVTALRQWLQEELRRFEKAVQNPMHDGWIDVAMQQLTRELGRGRMTNNLPPVLTDATLSEMVAHADVNAREETQTISYVCTNVTHGTRAHDNEFLDRRDSTRQVADESAGQRAGRKIKHVSTKNNKAQEDRPKALPCRSGCCGNVSLTDSGGFDASKVCPNCMLEFAETQVDAKVSATEEVAATLPQYIDAKELSELDAGCTLVRCEAPDDQTGEASAFVCVVSPSEHAAGMGYDGSEPFVVNGKQKRPPVRGTWFEVPKTGCAVRVWSDASGVTRRLQKQLAKTNERAGYEVMAPKLIKKVTSKSMRRTMATKLTRLLGLDAAVEMGEWSSRAMAKLYVEEADALATATYNSTDVMLKFSDATARLSAGAPFVLDTVRHSEAPPLWQEAAPASLAVDVACVCATATPAIDTAAPLALEMAPASLAVAVAGEQASASPLVPDSVATELPLLTPPPRALATLPMVAEEAEAAQNDLAELLRASLQQVLGQASSGAPAPMKRIPYGTKHVSAAETAQRCRQSKVCCPDRRVYNPLKRTAVALHKGAEQSIDAMASSSAAAVRDMLCSRYDMHASCREVETFRQKRFREAGGRASFIARMMSESGTEMEASEVIATRTRDRTQFRKRISPASPGCETDKEVCSISQADGSCLKPRKWTDRGQRERSPSWLSLTVRWQEHI